MVIGERLKQIRKSKKMSQGDVEHKTGLLRCYVSRCENGHTIPNLTTLAKWAGALDVNMSQLFFENGQSTEPLVLKTNGNGNKMSRTTKNNLHRLESAFIKLDPKNQTLALDLVRKMARG